LRNGAVPRGFGDPTRETASRGGARDRRPQGREGIRCRGLQERVFAANREDKEQGDWGKNLQEARVNLKKMYGDYRIADFTFTYDGDTEGGKVSFAYKHGKPLDLDVINEDHAWKVDKR